MLGNDVGSNEGLTLGTNDGINDGWTDGKLDGSVLGWDDGEPAIINGTLVESTSLLLLVSMRDTTNEPSIPLGIGSDNVPVTQFEHVLNTDI